MLNQRVPLQIQREESKSASSNSISTRFQQLGNHQNLANVSDITMKYENPDEIFAEISNRIAEYYHADKEIEKVLSGL